MDQVIVDTGLLGGNDALAGTPHYQQGSFDDLATLTPLRDTTFMVVDLETTGATPAVDAITEIGAVKVRGGHVLGEFTTLVNPRTDVPVFITSLTGISTQMVRSAPLITSVLPSFLEFAHGCVWVAHNAPFDVGFLRAAARRHGYAWAKPRTIDTVTLARRIISKEEVPNHRLASLAQFFQTSVTPTHRALDDARATVDVLYGLLERVGNLGIHTLEELTAFTRRVTDAQRRKRHLARDLPNTAGVYIFRAADDRPLYVGTSRNIRARVRNYFLSSETRSRMGEMVAVADRVEAVECAHALEAQIREVKLIAAHKPPYNRRDKYPERTSWLKLTDEPYPRLSVVRNGRFDDRHLGPFRSQSAAKATAEAIYEALPIRRCGGRLSIRRTSSACALAELNKCGAPCEHRESVDEYGVHVARLIDAIRADPGAVISDLLTRIGDLSRQSRFEDAAALRDRLTMLLRTVQRMQRMRALRQVPELVAAQRGTGGAWSICIIRHGRLASAATAPRAIQVLPTIATMRATALHITDEHQETHPSELVETELILNWLAKPGTRIADVDGEWSCPTAGAERWTALTTKLRAAATSIPSK